MRNSIKAIALTVAVVIIGACMLPVNITTAEYDNCEEFFVDTFNSAHYPGGVRSTVIEGWSRTEENTYCAPIGKSITHNNHRITVSEPSFTDEVTRNGQTLIARDGTSFFVAQVKLENTSTNAVPNLLSTYFSATDSKHTIYLTPGAHYLLSQELWEVFPQYVPPGRLAPPGTSEEVEIVFIVHDDIEYLDIQYPFDACPGPSAFSIKCREYGVWRAYTGFVTADPVESVEEPSVDVEYVWPEVSSNIYDIEDEIYNLNRGWLLGFPSEQIQEYCSRVRDVLNRLTRVAKGWRTGVPPTYDAFWPTWELGKILEGTGEARCIELGH